MHTWFVIDVYFKRKNIHNLGTTTQYFVLNVEPPKKAQRCELQQISIAFLEWDSRKTTNTRVLF